MAFSRRKVVVVKRKKVEKVVNKAMKVIEKAFAKPVSKIDREARKESNGFVVVFECWNCKNRIEKHYGRLASVNSNTVGNCVKCGKQNPFEVVRRINDR